MRLVKGYDVSFGRTTRAWCAVRRAEGYEVAVYDAFTGGEQSSKPLETVTPPNLDDARAERLVGVTYSNVAPWHTSGAYCLDQASRVAGAARLQAILIIAIDIELIYYQPTSEWLDEEVVHAAIREAKARGFRPVGYSARWAINWWALHLGHVPKFDCDGWYANYNNVPVIDEREAPACLTDGHRWIGKQWGGRTIDGVEIDENVFDLEWFEQEEDMGAYDKAILDAVATLTDGEYVGDGYAIYYVEKKGDVPVLKRVDDSRASIITNVRAVPLGVSMLLFHGEQIA